jgi:tetratricopeptide (TPR) repeat protein
VALKKLLYADLTEKEYFETMADAPPAPDAPPAFDYGYVQQLGLSLINDEAHWQRGGEYLRMAAHGLPTLGPTLFLQIANAHQRVGHGDQARHNFELAKRAGQAIGAKNLAEAERQAYFAVVKHLGDEASAANDLDAAIENYRLFAESERSGAETLRTLADLYERKGDALTAARMTEKGLLYSPQDADLLARKDRYYFSIMPDELGERLEQARGFLDFDYCLRRSKTILDGKFADAEWLEVASHLSKLATVLKPDSLRAKVLQARVHLRFGERDEAAAILERVRSPKPEAFGSGDEEEAWYQSCQILGDLYLEAGKPDVAVECLTEFNKSAKSGARTLYRLGQAYELLGDLPKAVRCYQKVTAYDGNPLVYDARSAISRLQTS